MTYLDHVQTDSVKISLLKLNIRMLLCSLSTAFQEQTVAHSGLKIELEYAMPVAHLKIVVTS